MLTFKHLFEVLMVKKIIPNTKIHPHKLALDDTISHTKTLATDANMFAVKQLINRILLKR